MRRLKLLPAICALLICLPAIALEPDAGHVKVVRDFIAAFNSHDSAAMSKFVAEDVQWLSISTGTIFIDTVGKAALVAAMNDYFDSCATCRSELAGVLASRDRVSAIEVATWHGENGAMSQRAMSVYEFDGNLIKRVYYFPAEK